MSNELIQAGKTVDEAIDIACQKLGCEREDCQWEIIDLPKRGFLGIKNSPAKVRVRIPTSDAPAPAAPKAPAPQRPVQQPPAKREEPRPAAPAQKPVQQPQASAPAVPVQPPSDECKEKAADAASYLVVLLKEINLPQAKVETVWEEGGACLRIHGDGLGIIIGRRGETLDALQYLCGLVANRVRDGYLRITVDCGDYRLKRKSTLEALAKKLSAQVIKTGSSRTLEPMNPFERRIIHAIVSEIEGVNSTSAGEEPNRRVVITGTGARSGRRPPKEREQRERPPARTPISDRPDWPDKGAKGDRPDDGRSPPRRSGPGRGRPDRNDRRPGPGGRDRRDRPPAYQPVKEPDSPPTEADNKPLYGKIDLE